MSNRMDWPECESDGISDGAVYILSYQVSDLCIQIQQVVITYTHIATSYLITLPLQIHIPCCPLPLYEHPFECFIS